MFVAAYRHHGVVPICRTLQVAPSAVRSAMSRPVCARRVTDDAIKPKLLEVFNANYQVYGRRKMKPRSVASMVSMWTRTALPGWCVSWAFVVQHGLRRRSRPARTNTHYEHRIW